MLKKHSKPSSNKTRTPASKTESQSLKKNTSVSKTLVAKSPLKKSTKKKSAGTRAKATSKKAVPKKAQKKKAPLRKTTTKKAAAKKSTTATKKGAKKSVTSKAKKAATSKLTTKAKSTAGRKKGTPKKKSPAAKKAKTIAKGAKKPTAVKKTLTKAKTAKKAPIKIKKPALTKSRPAPAKRRVEKKKKAPIRPPFSAYKGIRPYLFTSYAHKNMSEVFSVIKRLNKYRFRIWYDEGIEPGNEWPEVVGTAIVNCTQFLVFMSPNAADSRNVRNEINLAFNEHKDILVVFLQPTNLTEGMRLQIGTVQFINKYALTDQDFFDKITKVLSNNLKN